MKTLFMFFLATMAVAAQTNTAWFLKTGEAFTGNYFTSGRTSMVIKTGGTNCILKIADLTPASWLDYYDCKTNARQKQIDAEATQLNSNGWMEFTSDLLENFPEKVDNKRGWIDGRFKGLENTWVEFKTDELGISILDKNENWNGKIVAFKTDKDGNACPVISQINELKFDDRVRLFGLASVGGIQDNETRFYVDKIEIIESKSDADFAEKMRADYSESQADAAAEKWRLENSANQK